jgi:citronellol/citronellal dehydrogenase
MAWQGSRTGPGLGVELTGRFLIDDSFLAENGIEDLEHYRVDPTQTLAPDFFVPDDIPPPPAGLPQ